MSSIIQLADAYDMHVHFRQGDMLQKVAPLTARHFSRALVMPNTKPPVRTAEEMLEYQTEIQKAIGTNTSFQPLMTFKIFPDTTPQLVRKLKGAGVTAGKIYPRGLTTNAEDGIDDFFALGPILREMEKQDIVLCIHGEKPGKNIEGLDREAAFLRTIYYFARTYPDLRIVLEHITTEAAVEAILQLPDNVAATITVHHLYLSHDDVGGDKMRPHHYCKPVAKKMSDRAALVEAAISGCPKFMFGSDSAPHPREGKECSECCAGVFTAPIALPLLAQKFEEHKALDRLEQFVYCSARDFYRIRGGENTSTLRLIREPTQVPESYDGIIPFCAGQEILWRVEK